ncbi:MAG: hypothetical protein ABIJ96_03090 [Elusimicrobiota bacterium]
MTVRKLGAALIVLVFLAATAQSAQFAGSARLAQKLTTRAHTVGQDSRDMALAALYNRLFALQDLKREEELKIDEVELLLGDLYQQYKKLDRFVGGVDELKEIAQDPEHRRYPNLTESSKLKLLELVAAKIRIQTLAGFRIKRLERDIADVWKMIREHQERNPKQAR